MPWLVAVATLMSLGDRSGRTTRVSHEAPAEITILAIVAVLAIVCVVVMTRSR